MKRALQVLSPSPTQAQALLNWALALVALPLALFIAVAVLLPQPPKAVTPIQTAELWLEPLGQYPFDQAHLTPLVGSAPDFTQAVWQTVTLPNSAPLAASVDLPDDAPKVRAWFRLRIPPEFATSRDIASSGRLGLMGNRVMGGPWAVWVDGHLVQANLADWRMQWNTPLRVMLPPLTANGGTAGTILIAVPFAQAQGYAMGSLFIGPADAIDGAWAARNFWGADLSRAATLVATVLMLATLQLALGRRKERIFVLLCANAAYWAVSNLQYFYDFTGQETLSRWFGAAVDVSINWVVVLSILFAFEFEQIKLPRLRVVLVLYACGSVLLTLPLWQWGQNALVAQHYINVAVFLGCGLLFLRHVVRNPSREGVALCVAILALPLLGLHDVMALSAQHSPDDVYLYPMGGAIMFMLFMYVTNRRYLSALSTSERHQSEMQEKLLEQEQRLAEQHLALQRLEIDKSLVKQHETIMQDLHDGMGSNLTSALLQARGGALTPSETLLLLQDLTDELRNLRRSALSDQRGLNEVLAELRQRVQHRLTHGGIRLKWMVEPSLPAPCCGPAVGQHLRAMLSEAIANVIKHAGATQITVGASVQGDSVVIEIIDDGQGCDLAQVDPGRGLIGMRQRAQALGAALDIDTAPGQGCRWRLQLPLTPTL